MLLDFFRFFHFGLNLDGQQHTTALLYGEEWKLSTFSSLTKTIQISNAYDIFTIFNDKDPTIISRGTFQQLILLPNFARWNVLF